MTQFSQCKELTVYESKDIQLQPERREHNRQIAILRIAKIISGSREGWGYVKNLSASGMMVQLASDFELGNMVTVILSEGQELTGSVQWRESNSVGIQFSEPVDIAEMLEKTSPRQNGRVSRIPRVKVTHPVSLLMGLQLVQADICDISPTGICVRTDVTIEKGKQVRMLVTGLIDISGVVRWQSGNRIGISFNQRLPLNDLMRWLSYNCDAANDNIAEVIETESKSLVPMVPTKLSRSTTEEVYQVMGHDDLGREKLIAVLRSVEDVIVEFRAASRNFSRASVRNANGVELSYGTLLERAQEKRRAAYSNPATEVRPNILVKC